MSVFRALVARILGLFGRAARDRDLSDEFAAHLAMSAAEYERRGHSPGDAQRLARLDAGSLADAAESYRDRRGLPMVETTARTLRLAYRSLWRTPGFLIAAVLTLALGIGLATAVFTVADALALRKLPVRDQNRIVVLWGRARDGRFDNYPVDGAEEFVRRSHALQSGAYFAWFGAVPIAVRDGDRVTRLRRALVSGGFFDVVGTHPLLGRALRPADDEPGAARAMVISYGVWQQRYGGAPDILGRRVPLYDGSRTYTIVGVMPQGFDYPTGTEFWASLTASLPPATLSLIGYDVIGRLATVARPADAAHELSAYFARPEASVYQHTFEGVAHTLPDLVLGNTKPALMVFALAAALLLLITCVNVANLLLVRGLARVREIAVRLALGAGRTAVVGQLLTENALLAVAGGLLGVGVAAGAVRLFVAFAPSGTPRLDEVRLNGMALVAAVGITTVAVVVFALVPAVMTSRVDLQEALRSGTRQTASKGNRLVADALVAGQVALALIVLSTAALIGRSLINLERAPLGFSSSHLLIADLALQADRLSSLEKTDAMLEALTPKLLAIPGVIGVSPEVAAPFSGSAGWSGRPARAGQSASEAAANQIVNMELVGTGYFKTMQMSIARGRGFTDDDRTGTPGVVVVSRAAADAYWPNEDPIGKRLSMGAKRDDTFTVVGLVPDTRYHTLREPAPSIYFALRQSIFEAAPTALVVRTSGPPADMVPTLRRVIDASGLGVALSSAAPFESYLDGPLGQPRLDAFLLAVFAAAAVALCAIGLFGVMAATVRQRTRELAVRAALGATGSNLTGMVMRRGVAIVAVGVAAGLTGALVGDGFLQSLVYGVSPTDMPTLAVVSAMLVGVGVVAVVVPARRAMRVDPMLVLRDE
ncbi:MAG: ADOP family duplicated permease [Gemmatimonadaceae bacterium]